ncbi:MAG: HNH endonuclease, partial [Treponema sp.]|nr:HNH endonuclease [Treponema sp.]
MSLYARNTGVMLYKGERKGEEDWYRNVSGSSSAMNGGQDRVDVTVFSVPLVQMWRDLTKEHLPPVCPGCGKMVDPNNWIGAHIVIGGQTDLIPVYLNQVFIIPTCQRCNRKHHSPNSAFKVKEEVKLVQLIGYGLYAQEEYITWAINEHGVYKDPSGRYEDVNEYNPYQTYTIYADGDDYQQFLKEATDGEAQWNYEFYEALEQRNTQAEIDDGERDGPAHPSTPSNNSRHSDASTPRLGYWHDAFY